MSLTDKMNKLKRRGWYFVEEHGSVSCNHINGAGKSTALKLDERSLRIKGFSEKEIKELGEKIAEFLNNL